MNKILTESTLQHILLEDYQVIVAPIDRWRESSFDLHRYSRFYILVDQMTRHYCLPVFKTSEGFRALEATGHDIEVVEMPAGERYKNLDTCTSVWKQLMDKKADRKSLMINLGGGVLGDLGGFCASTFMRGMDFIQMPTTLLAMADASVGGKVGVDFHQVKNYIGLFCQPKQVWIDPIFLETLPTRHLLNGMAEVIKHALIADRPLYNYLEKTPWTLEEIDWNKLLLHSVQIKADIVSADVFENGVRKKLNFGHTVGHALETQALTMGQDILHGEAIVAGMLVESYLSMQYAGLTLDHFKSIERLFLDRYDKIDISKFRYTDIQKLIGQDKKKKGNEVGFTLLSNIGESVFDLVVKNDDVETALKYYKEL